MNRAPLSRPDRPDALIELHRVVKTFKNAAGEFTVLKGIDASFAQGEFVSVVGRSGSGKSTLLNMMTGIDHPTSGQVRVGSMVLHTLSEGQMSVWRGRNMGIVFQFFQLLPMLTLMENVMLPMDFCETYPPAEREPRARALLKEVDLEGLEHKYPAAVSGGQQQSAAVARALANDPPILVADEPTGNLDTRTAELILNIFEQQVERDKTVIMVTHDNNLAQRAARRLVISDGELLHECVSSAFPEMPHNLLLELSHAAEPLELPPGADLLTLRPDASLVMVCAGRLDLLKNGRSGLEQVEALSPGMAFSPRFTPQFEEKRAWFAPRLRENRSFVVCAGEQGARTMLVSEASLNHLVALDAGFQEYLEKEFQDHPHLLKGK